MTTTEKNLTTRVARFLLALTVAFSFVYVVLPCLTRQVPILQRMSENLEATGIDPSRYYFTDVEQVKEAEIYLRSVLAEKGE